MLEHAIDPEDAGSEPALPPGSAQDGHYVPPHTAEPLLGGGKVPSVKRFNRKMLAIIAAVAGVVVTLAFAVGLQQPKAKAPEAVATTT